MEVEYRLQDIKAYREWLTEIGEEEKEYSDKQILNLLANDF